MNLEQLQKQLNQMVKLRPPAQFQRSIGDFIPVDWQWRVASVDKTHGRTELHGNDYVLTLMSDHIKEFMRSSDPNFKGFLLLKVDVCIQGNKVNVEPQVHHR
jgi:hypothetical protein